MNEIIFLGTGGASATPERDNTSLLLRRDENLILVDCPGSVTRKIKSLGLDPRNLCALHITHEHPDHKSGYGRHKSGLSECVSQYFCHLPVPHRVRGGAIDRSGSPMMIQNKGINVSQVLFMYP